MTSGAAWRTAAVFLVVMAAGACVLLSDAAQAGVLRTASIALTSAAAACLDAIGVDVVHVGQRLGTADRTFEVMIENDCNGAWAHLILLASVLAYPATGRERLVGLVVAQPVLAILNLLRIVALVLIGAYWPSMFRAAHVYVFQFLIIGCALALFVWWADRRVRPAL